MYSVILLTAMSSAGPACHTCSMPRRCCPVQYGCCGVVMFFWATPGGTVRLVDQPNKLWLDYVAALDEPERSNVLELWERADAAGREKLLAQIATMHPPVKEADKEADREADRTVRRGSPAPSRHAWNKGG